MKLTTQEKWTLFQNRINQLNAIEYMLDHPRDNATREHYGVTDRPSQEVYDELENLWKELKVDYQNIVQRDK